LAVGPRDEVELAPAGGAERAVIGHEVAAGGTERRQRGIEREPGERPHRCDEALRQRNRGGLGRAFHGDSVLWERDQQKWRTGFASGRASRNLSMQAQSGPINWQALFDQHALKAHTQRARKLGPATFLIERVAEDLADRL